MTKSLSTHYVNHNQQLADLRVSVLESSNWTDQERIQHELYHLSQYMTDHSNGLNIRHV